MSTITAIEVQKRGKDRVNVSLDGAFAFSLGIEVLEKQGLRLGQMLSDSQREELVKADLFHKCLNAALHLLSYRPRSEAEVRIRLRPRFEEQAIDSVIVHLKARHMVDDVAFAQFWKENRESFSPRSKRMIMLELRRKGIDSEVITDVVEAIDDEQSAYRAAEKKARSWAKEDYNAFRRKLGAFLSRRGFSSEVANSIMERLWQESR